VREGKKFMEVASLVRKGHPNPLNI
jgi:hypothetical protein